MSREVVTIEEVELENKCAHMIMMMVRRIRNAYKGRRKKPPSRKINRHVTTKIFVKYLHVEKISFVFVYLNM